MATTIQTIVTLARKTLLEPTADFWTDPELLAYANDGIKDLWRQIIDLYKNHFVTIDETNFTLAVGTSLISGVPADLFRVLLIRPRIVGENSSNPGLIFSPRDLTHNDFVQAEAERAIPPRQRQIFYAVINAGAPVGAPAIQCAPQVTDAVNLTVKYVPSLPIVALTDNNPVPGESDMALRMFVLAWARARTRADNQPDPDYVAMYNTEVRKLLAALTPRSEQEPEVVESFFMDYGAFGRD